jgi:hypothetical protein
MDATSVARMATAEAQALEQILRCRGVQQYETASRARCGTAARLTMHRPTLTL